VESAFITKFLCNLGAP